MVLMRRLLLSEQLLLNPYILELNENKSLVHLFDDKHIRLHGHQKCLMHDLLMHVLQRE
ncbi:hypothetical protein SDC9_182931 [bioreactor metagenome]|uniref:Uncharacterized protein n=1 Tax=bioreactor metagenome TaxID=1076179 RepID=A0A645HID5_9ZZZZ